MRFPLTGEDGAATGESLLVWTTTPWTLPGNVARRGRARTSTYVRARRGRRDAGRSPRRSSSRVLGEGAEIARHASPAPSWSAAPTAARSSTLTDGGPAGAFTVIAGDFVTTEDGTGIVHIAPAFGEDDFDAAPRRASSTRSRRARQAAPLYNPVAPRRHLRRPRRGLRGQLRQGRRGHRGADRRPRRARPPLPRRGLRALLPALLALRHAAALLREVELVHPHDGRQATSCWRTTRTSTGTRSTSSTAASATGSRTTSTGRSRASATGARRCRSGAARTASRRSASARAPSSRELTGARAARRPAPPYIDDVTFDCAHGDGTMRRVPEVIDVWFDSGAMPFAQWHYPFENEDEVRAALPGRLHLRGARPDARLVLLAARDLDAAVRHAPPTRRASASA